MTAKKHEEKPKAGHAHANPDVIEFLRELDHPLKKDIETVRQIILDAGSDIREGIKWNAPSFCTSEYFATFNLHAKDRVQLVFHLGAKVKDNATKGMTIGDPAGLLNWLAKDRCLVTLGHGKDIKAHRSAFQAIVREWIRHVAALASPVQPRKV